MKNWLKTNIVELVAIIGVIQFVIIMLYVLFAQVKTTDSTTLMILAYSSGAGMTVIGYYFGSSKGSKDKQAVLDKKDLDKSDG